MEFATWAPAYEAIIEDFGYDRAGDEAARDELAGLVAPFDLERLDQSGRTVAVAGGAPTLVDEVDRAASADAVFAASTAADVLEAAGVDVDCLVTDLDKNPRTAVAFTRADIPVAVAAHGDNRDALATWVPRMDTDYVLGTTQAAPAGPVVNLGGFTDGDRAAFIADACGAERLQFPGWDFDDPGVGPEKRRKLDWAARLLAWLERRRGEQFAVLDGRRAGVDLSFLDG